MQKHQPAKLPMIGEIESRAGARSAIKTIFEYFRSQVQNETAYRNAVYQELAFLYGEFDYTPVLIGAGAQGIVTVTVPDAQLSYTVEFSYDQDLQGIQATAYVASEGLVDIVLSNGTGGGVTLAAGRFRVYCYARIPSS